MDKKRIIILTNIPSPYRVALFNYLIDNYIEYEFRIVYSASLEEDRGWKINNSEIKNSIFLKSKSIKMNGSLDYKHIHIPMDIVEVLNKENPDIVIASEYNPTALISYFWSKVKKKKYISWSDGTLNSEKNINSIQKILRKLICSGSDALIASSSMTKEAQKKYGAKPNKIFVSHLTVDINEYLHFKKNISNKQILFVGRLINIKGLDLLLEAIADIDKEFVVNIVGDGPEKENLIRLAKELKIQEKVNFLGSKQGNDLLDQYKKSDIFILPSRQDCFGVVITEAMCNCMPIIASKFADGAYDLIDKNINGFIVDPFNKNQLKKKIELLLNNKDIVIRMGNESYKKVGQFSIENISKEYIKAIEF